MSYIDQFGKRWKDRAEYEYFQKLAPKPPTVERHSDETVERHRAYGQIQASRVQGRATLFGSDFEHAAGFIKVTIARSSMTRTLSHDWPHPDHELIEVWLSEAQWAAFVSTLNYGTGVPCTLRFVRGEDVIPQIERVTTKREQFKAEASEHLKQAEALVATLQRALDEGKLRGIKKDKLQGILWQLKNNLTNGLNFVADSFGKHVEDTIESAKVEIEAYLQGVLQRAGARALADGALADAGDAPLLLPDKEEKT